MGRTLTFSAVLWVLAYCLPAAASSRLNDDDRALVCAVSEVALSSFNAITAVDETAVDEADSRALIGNVEAEAGEYKHLPRRVRCGKRWVTLRPRGYGTYIDAFLISADRRQIVMSGGYQGSVLDGANGSCLFRRDGKQWDVVGCDVTGVS